MVALYTNEDCFLIAFESEEELLKWFNTLIKIQLSDRVSEGEELKPIYGETQSLVHLQSSDPIKSTNNLLLIIKILRSTFLTESSGGGVYN